VSPDGKRCGSRHKLELGHIRPVALGGKSTLDNVRLECRPHNRFEAVRVFGREHMAPFARRGTSSSGSHGP
jgi:5-methylcytosine-specific restriction endonuclease McrA